jgi:hypothetical protein
MLNTTDQEYRPDERQPPVLSIIAALHVGRGGRSVMIGNSVFVFRSISNLVF